MKNHLLQFFEFNHLPAGFQQASQPFHTLAYTMDELLEDGPEKSAMFRKLIEAKDCAVRQYISTYKSQQNQIEQPEGE